METSQPVAYLLVVLAGCSCFFFWQLSDITTSGCFMNRFPRWWTCRRELPYPGPIRTICWMHGPDPTDGSFQWAHLAEKPQRPGWVTPQMLHATQVVFPMSSKKGCENFLLVLLWQPCNFQTITEMGKNFTRWLCFFFWFVNKISLDKTGALELGAEMRRWSSKPSVITQELRRSKWPLVAKWWLVQTGPKLLGELCGHGPLLEGPENSMALGTLRGVQQVSEAIWRPKTASPSRATGSTVICPQKATWMRFILLISRQEEGHVFWPLLLESWHLGWVGCFVECIGSDFELRVRFWDWVAKLFDSHAETLRSYCFFFFRCVTVSLAHLNQKCLIGAKNDFVLCSVLANICRRMMETVSVLPFGKVRENRKREMMIFISQASTSNNWWPQRNAWRCGMVVVAAYAESGRPRKSVVATLILYFRLIRASAKWSKAGAPKVLFHGMFLPKLQDKNHGQELWVRQCFVDWHLLDCVQEFFGVDAQALSFLRVCLKRGLPNSLPLPLSCQKPWQEFLWRCCPCSFALPCGQHMQVAHGWTGVEVAWPFPQDDCGRRELVGNRLRGFQYARFKKRCWPHGFSIFSFESAMTITVNQRSCQPCAVRVVRKLPNNGGPLVFFISIAWLQISGFSSPICLWRKVGNIRKRWRVCHF